MDPQALRTLPKVELHRHLECSIRPSTLRELLKLAGFDVPADPKAFSNLYLVTEPMDDLESVLRKFLATQKVLSTEKILERIAYEAVEDAFNEGIRILELRYAPTFVQQGHENLSFDQIHQAFCRGLDRARKQFPVAVGLIAIIQRILPVSEGKRVTDFVIANRDTFIGIDLADNEVGFDSKPFAPLFEKARAAGVHVTIHSGEADVPGSSNFVRDAIEILGAERIGHGVQIYQSPEMIDFVKSKRVPLELCPTSNWLTHAVKSLSQHPIRQLMEAGVDVTLNSDDPGVFGIDLTNEYQVLQSHLNFTEREFKKLNDTAARVSFIPLKDRQAVWPGL